MVGPDVNGQGGISRVVKLWENGSLQEIYNIAYIPTASDKKISKIFFFAASLGRFLRQIDRNVSGVYVHTASRNSFYRKSVFILLAKLLGKKIVVHIHPSFFSRFLSEMKGVRRVLFHRLLKSVDGIVVLTPGIGRDIKALFPNQEISVLPNPVNISKMENRNRVRRLESRILYLGWYTKEKGIYDLVDAVGILRRRGVCVELEMHGTKEVERFRRYVADKGLDEWIIVNGWIGEERKIDALYRSAMLVLPSYTEGIPNVILEAMATKTPIVSTLVGGLKDILRDGENAIIAEVNNPEDLSEKILALLNDKILADRIAKTAFIEAQEKYDIHVIKVQFGQMLKRFTLA